MDSPREWRVASFSAERGFGRIENAATGDEATFALETWSPCNPVTARTLQDSEHRRHLLLPQVGEPVEVEWKVSRSGKNVPARVVRRRPVECVLPAMTFATWLQRVGRHVTAVSEWSDDEWTALFRQLDEDIEDAVRSSELVGPELHLSVLAWLREHAPAELVARRLQWLSPAPGAGLVAAEATNDAGHAFLDLPSATIERLAEEKLILIVPASADSSRR